MNLSDPEGLKKDMQEAPGDFLRGLIADMNETLAKSYGEPLTLKLPEGEPYPGGDFEFTNDFTKIEKAGLRIPFSFEQFAGDTRKGEYVPTGSKTLQRIGWLWGLLKFKLYRKLESSLDKSRHFEGVGGYDWEESYYRDFKQETRFVLEK